MPRASKIRPRGNRAAAYPIVLAQPLGNFIECPGFCPNDQLPREGITKIELVRDWLPSVEKFARILLPSQCASDHADTRAFVMSAKQFHSLEPERFQAELDAWKVMEDVQIERELELAEGRFVLGLPGGAGERQLKGRTPGAPRVSCRIRVSEKSQVLTPVMAVSRE